jgi:hypothetical protein
MPNPPKAVIRYLYDALDRLASHGLSDTTERQRFYVLGVIVRFL